MTTQAEQRQQAISDLTALKKRLEDLGLLKTSYVNYMNNIIRSARVVAARLENEEQGVSTWLA